MEHVEDDGGSEGARGVALMWCDVKHVARLQDVGDAGDRELEGAAQEQRSLLVQVGMIGADGTGSDVNAALSNMVRVDVAAKVAWSDLTRCNGIEVE